jgi:hypothetical protein
MRQEFIFQTAKMKRIWHKDFEGSISYMIYLDYVILQMKLTVA